MITIVDYGMGNLGSIQNMFKKVGAQAIISRDISEISNASKIVLPGVGSFDTAMSRINQEGLREVLDRLALVDKIPILGICLGMQIMTRGSEEGKSDGLNWIPADTRRISAEGTLKVPHMGWNIVRPATPSKLTEGLGVDDARFYFVHSYSVCVDNESNSILKTLYGNEFDSAIQKDNIYGVQFHPEKSHKFGMQIFKNFLNL